MATKYVLWRVSNGWLMTYGNTIWEDWERRSTSAVFHTLKEFSDWAEGRKPELKSQLQPRTHGKFAAKPKPTNRIADNARGTTVSR